jgi:hypothetical protein
MFGEKVRSYCENHYKIIYTEMQDIEFVSINTGDTYYFSVLWKVNTQLVSMILLTLF